MRISTIVLFVAVWLGSTFAFPIQYTSGSYHVAALERRADEPPRPKLTEAQYNAKLQRSTQQMFAAFEKDPGMEAKVLKTLGLKRFGGESLQIPELNNALRQAGYEGPFLPETDELEESSVYRGELSREYLQQEDSAWPKIMLALKDPILLGRLRRALGLNPEGPIPSGHYTDQEWNEALRKAGYQGMLFPETDPPRPRILMRTEKVVGSDPESGGSGGRGSGGKGSGGKGSRGGGSSGRGFGGQPNRGKPNKFSLDDDDDDTSRWSLFLSRVRQSLGPFPAGPRSQPAPLLPNIHRPLIPLK